MGRMNRKLFWLGFDDTVAGLKRKLPLFAAAADAMLILTLLDGVKANYDIRTGSARSYLVISDEFLKTLNPEAAKQEAAVNTEASGKPESMDNTLWDWL